LDSRWSISYWWSIGPKSLSLTVSKIFSPKHHVRHNAKSSLRMRVSRDMYPYVKFKYIFQFLTPTLPIHYVTFIELRWRIRGVLSLTSNVKGQKFAKFWPFRWPGDQGVWKVAIFTAKGTSLRESTSIGPFCVNVRWGVWSQSRDRKKVRKSPTPIGMMCRR